MSIGRYMVCDDCLKTYFGGEEKCCSHGWDLMVGKPIERECSKCKRHATRVHCPAALEQ